MRLRLYEFKGDDKNNLFSFSQMQDASSVLQLSTIETTQNMLDNIQIILSEILHNNVQHLHNIKHYPRYSLQLNIFLQIFIYFYYISRRYVDVVATTLKQKLNLIDRMITQQESVRQKQDDTQNQIDKLRPLLKLVVQRTKELQTEVHYLCSRNAKFLINSVIFLHYI